MRIGDVLEQLGEDLGANSAADIIEDVVVLLVSGADITDDIYDSVADFQSGQYSAFGKDLGDIATILQDKLHCNSRACKLVEGFLQGTDKVFTTLQTCEDDLKIVEDDFVKAWSEFKNKDYKHGVKDLSAALQELKKALSSDDCGLGDTFSWLDHDADTFSLSTGADIIVHGVEFSFEVDAFMTDYEKHDYRAAGGDLNDIMKSISQWSEEHSCEKVSCYVVEGIMQAEEILEGNIKQCELDFERAWSNFTAAVRVFEKTSTLAKVTLEIAKDIGDENPVLLENSLSKEIEESVRDIGYGLEDVAKGVGDCHLEELAELLAKLATELAFPEVMWVAEVLHILINGSEIANDIGEACVDFGDENFVSFGSDLAKLIKVLL